jgi:hypothetical protein
LPWGWILAVLAFNLAWYGSFLAFPLIGEDGAANYSFLMETIRFGEFFRPTFPIKWLEGLGQPNMFVSVTFDPFSWLMYAPLPPPDAFRVSYALRATVCWLTTFLLTRALFRRAPAMAVTAAWFSMLLAFVLTSSHGIATFAGIPVATHAALFPGLLWLYLRVVRQRRPVGLCDIAFALAVVWFMVVFPFGTLLPLGVLFVFAAVLVVTSRRAKRRRAWWAWAKLAMIVGVALFAPVVGLFHAWSALAAVSARYVFAKELWTYGREYLLPLLWHDVPLGARVIVLLALVPPLVMTLRYRPALVAILTIATIVTATQLVTIARGAGLGANVLERLPRPQYAEYHLAVFYAIMAAYAVHHWRRVLRPSRARRRWWPFTIVSVGALSWVLVGAWALWFPFSQGAWRSRAMASAQRLVPTVVVALLVVGAVATWALWPAGVHATFADELLCAERAIWCRDRPGRSLGAGTSPITEFLRSHLAGGLVFRGRADFLMAAVGLDSEPEVGIMVRERIRNFVDTGNGMLLRALPLHDVPVASSYEQGLDHLYFLFWTRYINAGAVVARRSINFTALELPRRDRLGLVGVRYLIARDEAYDYKYWLPVAFTWKGYTVYDIPEANVAGYAPAAVTFAGSVVDELTVMRGSTFDPRQVVVVPASERQSVSEGAALSPLRSSSITIAGQALTFTATSGGRTVAVLPFRYSSCWRPEWTGTPGRLLRVDTALVGVVFDEATNVKLTWQAGYGPAAECLRSDAKLVRGTREAASILR